MCKQWSTVLVRETGELVGRICVERGGVNGFVLWMASARRESQVGNSVNVQKKGRRGRHVNITNRRDGYRRYIRRQYGRYGRAVRVECNVGRIPEMDGRAASTGWAVAESN